MTDVAHRPTDLEVGRAAADVVEAFFGYARAGSEFYYLDEVMQEAERDALVRKSLEKLGAAWRKLQEASRV